MKDIEEQRELLRQAIEKAQRKETPNWFERNENAITFALIVVCCGLFGFAFAIAVWG